MIDAALTTPFLISACVIAVAAAAPLMMALLGRNRPDDAERDAQRARTALAAARAADVLSQAEYDVKLALLPAATNSVSTPVAGRLAIVIAVLLPLTALALYAQFGEPRALGATQFMASAGTDSTTQAPDMAAALSGLEARLNANPDDAEGWHLLALGYQNTQQFDQALVAMRKMRDLMPEDLDVQVAYAEALALALPSKKIEGESADILSTVLQRDPQNQRALWLTGVAALQIGDNASALSHWRTLEGLLPEGSEMRTTLAQQIGDLDPAAAKVTAASVSGDTSTESPAPIGTAKHISVHISLDPKLQQQVAPSDTLFVFVRAATGPRMPLAIQRLTAGQLPLMVTLDDSMSMMPEMKLSKFPDIVIGARISKTGNATPGSGDLHTLTPPINQASIKDSVQLTINEIVP